MGAEAAGGAVAAEPVEPEVVRREAHVHEHVLIYAHTVTHSHAHTLTQSHAHTPNQIK